MKAISSIAKLAALLEDFILPIFHPALICGYMANKSFGMIQRVNGNIEHRAT